MPFQYYNKDNYMKPTVLQIKLLDYTQPCV